MSKKLIKYTLQYSEKKSQWDLQKDGSKTVVKSFKTKAAATNSGALEKALGKEGGSVKIQKQNGRFQEERTYSRANDPKRSKG